MLDKIRVLNFQAIERLTLSLDSITTIIGSSDRGKSALIRALRWVCLNEPGGAAFIRDGEHKVEVSLLVDGGRRVDRIRAKSTNEYQLDRHRYVSFGKHPPDGITNLLNVGSLNFQGQHDPPFWFHLSAGQVARELNAIVDLEIIDSAVGWINGELRKQTNIRDHLEEEVKEHRRDRLATQWTRRARTDWNRVEALQDDLEATRSRIAATDELLQRIADHREGRQNVGAAITDGETVLQTGRDLSRTRKKLTELESLLDDLECVERDQHATARQLKDAEAELSSVKECPLCHQPIP